MEKHLLVRSINESTSPSDCRIAAVAWRVFCREMLVPPFATPASSGWSRSYCVWSKSRSTLASSSICALLGGRGLPSGPISREVKNGSRRFAMIAGLATSGVAQLSRRASRMTSGSMAEPCKDGSTRSSRTAPSGTVWMRPANCASSRSFEYFSLSRCRCFRLFPVGCDATSSSPRTKSYSVSSTLNPLLEVADDTVQVLSMYPKRRISVRLRVVHTHLGRCASTREHYTTLHSTIIHGLVVRVNPSLSNNTGSNASWTRQSPSKGERYARRHCSECPTD